MIEGGDVRVEWLTVAGRFDAWRSIGLTVTDEGVIPLAGTSLRIVEPGLDGEGVIGWALSGVDPGIRSIDGLSTERVVPGLVSPVPHDLGAFELDHVVVTTDDLERTSQAIGEATGCELRRVRELGEVRQGFHRIGHRGLIVELVHRPEVPPGPATFWGFVINVNDLDAAFDRLGEELVGVPKAAVQPGRRIATVRAQVGLGVPLALMSR